MYNGCFASPQKFRYNYFWYRCFSSIRLVYVIFVSLRNGKNLMINLFFSPESNFILHFNICGRSFCIKSLVTLCYRVITRKWMRQNLRCSYQKTLRWCHLCYSYRVQVEQDYEFYVWRFSNEMRFHCQGMILSRSQAFTETHTLA